MYINIRFSRHETLISLNNSSSFSKWPNRSFCSSGAKCLGMHEGRSIFLYAAGRMLEHQSKLASADSRLDM